MMLSLIVTCAAMETPLMTDKPSNTIPLKIRNNILTSLLSWKFGRSNYSDLYFGISDESLGVDAGRTEKISTAMSALFSASQGKISKHWS